MPTSNIAIKDVPDLIEEDNEDDELYTGDNALAEGNHIFVVTVPCEAEFI